MMPNFWQLATTPILKIPYTISFDYSWFLAQSLILYEMKTPTLLTPLPPTTPTYFIPIA